MTEKPTIASLAGIVDGLIARVNELEKALNIVREKEKPAPPNPPHAELMKSFARSQEAAKTQGIENVMAAIKKAAA